MKKIVSLISVLSLALFISACNKPTATDNILNTGEKFEISGMVGYSDQPSDIGQEYCIIEGDVEFEYNYIDVYNEESELSGSTFYTKKDYDTQLLKEYIGQEVAVSGYFEVECHGIPYITDISIISD